MAETFDERTTHMITGRRIAGSLIAAAALSLTLLPAAAAEPRSVPREEIGRTVIDAEVVRTVARTHDHGTKRGTALSFRCKVSGKFHEKPPHQSANALKLLIKDQHGKEYSCKII